MTLAKRLLVAFEGSDAAYGETTVGRVGRKGKAEAKSFVRRGQLTEAQAQAHIDGKQGIGAIPITTSPATSAASVPWISTCMIWTTLRCSARSKI